MKDTLAIIPGNFSVPHAGHWTMIEHYANLADYVVVLVSASKTGPRGVSDNAIRLSPQKSKAILELFKARSGLNNVSIRVSGQPSPVKAALNAISKLSDCNVIIGYSDKDGASKYSWIRNTPEALKRGVTIVNPVKSAFHATNGISASGIRADIANFDIYQKFLPKFLTSADVSEVRKILYS